MHVIITEMQIKTIVNTAKAPTMLEWSKSRTLMPNAGEDVEQREPKFFAGGNAKW